MNTIKKEDITKVKYIELGRGIVQCEITAMGSEFSARSVSRERAYIKAILEAEKELFA